MLRETRLRCPICQATGTEQHREILHLQERDMRNMGFDFPSGNSPGNPTSLKSIRETEEALGEVEDILRGGG